MNPIELSKKFIGKTTLTPKQHARIELNTSKAREFAELINGQCPDNDEKLVAITKIEEALMWANKSAVREEV